MHILRKLSSLVHVLKKHRFARAVFVPESFHETKIFFTCLQNCRPLKILPLQTLHRYLVVSIILHKKTLNLQKGFSGVKSTLCRSLYPSTLAIPFPTPLQAWRTLNRVTTWSRSSSKMAGERTALTIVSMPWLSCCCAWRAVKSVDCGWLSIPPPRPEERQGEIMATRTQCKMSL